MSSLSSIRNTILQGVALSLALACLAPAAQAIAIRVSQETSVGTGDFDANILGTINTFDTTLSAAGFYSYDNPIAFSYNGDKPSIGGPAPLSSLTQTFFVNGSDGLSMFMVHDKPNDVGGGNVATNFVLEGGDTAGYFVKDEGTAVVAGGTVFNTNQPWSPCCTDGFVIGALDGNNWSMIGKLVDDGTGAWIDGITGWQATSNGGSNIGLVFQQDLRVRFDLAQVPEPTTLLLLGLGLAGLGYSRRNRG